MSKTSSVETLAGELDAEGDPDACGGGDDGNCTGDKSGRVEGGCDVEMSGCPVLNTGERSLVFAAGVGLLSASCRTW